MFLRRAFTASALALTGSMIAPLTIAAPACAASSTDPNTPTTVQTGITAKNLRGASAFGTTPDSTPETVSIVLRARNIAELESSVTHGTGPQLTVAQFADRYGQPTVVVAGIQAHLAHFGIASSAYSDRLDISPTGTAGQFNKALSIAQQQYHVPAIAALDGQAAVPAQTMHGNTRTPKLPHEWASPILALLGLTNYSSDVTHVVKRPTVTKQSTPTMADPNGCVALTGIASDCNLPQDFAKRYGLSGL